MGTLVDFWYWFGALLATTVAPAILGALVGLSQLLWSGTDGLRGKPFQTVALQWLAYILMAVGVAIVLAPGSVRLAFFCGLAVPFVVRASMSTKAFDNRRAEELRRTVQKAQEAVQKEPERPKNVWDLSKAQLDEYIDRNLSQVKYIFAITIGVMAAGFGLVVWGVYLAYGNQLQVAILTAVSGIITQTIGATFLFVYRSTVKQANDYVGTLERINAVGMAVSIVDLIPDKGQVKAKARAELAKQILASHAHRS